MARRPLRKGAGGKKNPKISAALKGNKNAAGGGKAPLGKTVTVSRRRFNAVAGGAIGGTLGTFGAAAGAGLGYYAGGRKRPGNGKVTVGRHTYGGLKGAAIGGALAGPIGSVVGGGVGYVRGTRRRK